MKRKTILSLSLLGALGLGLATAIFGLGPDHDVLQIDARCDDDAHGTLFVIVPQEGAGPAAAYRIDVASFCRNHETATVAYNYGAEVLVVFERPDGVLTSIKSQSGVNIIPERPYGASLLLKIETAAPYLSNDNI